MLVERIDPDWQWTKYRKVSVSDKGVLKPSYAIEYQPVLEASTLHRSLAQAYQDHRASGKKIQEVLENWISRFGLISGTMELFDGTEFMKEASQVWWIVQVFNVLRTHENPDRTIGIDPALVKSTDAVTLRLDIPNPGWLVGMDGDFVPYNWAIIKPPPEPTKMSDGTTNDHNDNISERKIGKDQIKWNVTYLELLEILGLTISKKLQDGVKLTFEALTQKPTKKAFVLGEAKLGEATLTGFPFLGSQRGRSGSRSDRDIRLEDTYAIETVLQPKDLLTYIWMLCAEELTELPDVEFEPCKNFDECGNVLKRDRARACKHCNKLVVQRNSTYLLYKKSNADYADYFECSKSLTKIHEVRKHQREYCTQNCSAKKRSKTSK